jgi:hypothetical protein
MTISVLIRLLSAGLIEGRVAGHAEVVDTGETVVFKDQEEMLAFLHRVGIDSGHLEGSHDGVDHRNAVHGQAVGGDG